MVAFHRWQATCFLPSLGRQAPACCRRYASAPFSTSVSRRRRTDKGDAPDAAADLGAQIRSVMRASAQPVAVITTNLPSEVEREVNAEGEAAVRLQRGYSHAATLSSFTTISLDPPLIAFSLRTPSRMADALSRTYLRDTNAPELDVDGSSSSEDGAVVPSQPARFVINILSAQQAFAAQSFAQPGLPAWCRYTVWTGADLASPSEDDELDALFREDEPHPMDDVQTHAARVARSRMDEDDDQETAVPVLSNAVGAFACSLVERINLQAVVARGTGTGKGAVAAAGEDDQSATSTTGSDLFIARVHAVEDREGEVEEDEFGEGELEPARRAVPFKEGITAPPPLLYYKQKYTTVSSTWIDPTKAPEEA